MARTRKEKAKLAGRILLAGATGGGSEVARVKKQIADNASILNLVEMWKEEESRKKMIQLAEMRKEVVKDEIKNLGTMDEVKARIMGISEDEVLNG